MHEVLEQFYLNQTEPNKSCFMALRSIILNLDKDVTETLKYGMPCFCYQKKMFCYLWTDKKTSLPYLLFVEGNFLHHPKLEKGTRSRMKTFTVDPKEDLPLETIRLLLTDALALYKSGKIKIK